MYLMDDPVFIQEQWKHYMGKYTSLTIQEVYDIYVKSKHTKKEKELLEMISKITGYYSQNPYCVRFLPAYNQG